jgi:hypothetical protein
VDLWPFQRARTSRRSRPPAGIPEVDPIPPLSSDRPSLKDQQARRREEPLIRPEIPPAARDDKPKVRKLFSRRVDRPFIKEIEPFAGVVEPRAPRNDRAQPKDREAPRAERAAPQHREPPVRAVDTSPARADRQVNREPPVEAAADTSTPKVERPAAPVRPVAPAAFREDRVEAADPELPVRTAEPPVPQVERPAAQDRQPPVRAVDPSPPRADRAAVTDPEPPVKADDRPAPHVERPAAQDRQSAVRAVEAFPPPDERVREKDREPRLRAVEEPSYGAEPRSRDYERSAMAEAPSPRWDDFSYPRYRDSAVRAEEIRPARDRFRAWDPEPTIRVEESWPGRHDRPGARDRDADSIPAWAWLILLVFLGAAAYIGYHYWQQQRGEQPAPSLPDRAAAPAPAPPGFGATEPEIRHPVPAAESGPATSLPALDQSDAAMRALVTDLVGAKNFQAMVNPQQLVRRIVATVDNLPRRTAPVQIRPIKPAPGQYVPSPANTRRYAGYVRAVEALDARALAQAYVAFYPLFQRAYADLGFPDRYFNDRVVEAIDDMLAAPDLTRPTELIQPKVFYQYADPRLESRSAGQKFMMRLGPENAAKVKAKLREIRQEIAKPVTGG